jgi:hypothetical protein
MSSTFAPSVSLLAALFSLAACATAAAPKTSAKPDPVTPDSVSKPDVKAEPAKDTDTLAEPVVKADPADPVSDKNRGFGPYDTLEAVCGTANERCRMSEPVTLTGSPAITRLATFVEQPMDGQTHLAFETKEGWFISEVPDGQPFGGGLSHHTPAGTYFKLDAAMPDGGEVILLRRYGQSSFIPGNGNMGSHSFEETVRLKCSIVSGRVACGEGKKVFSRSCSGGTCTQTGVEPKQ